MDERQHPGDDPGPLGQQIIGAVPECPLDYSFPSREVKERSGAMSEHELIPPPYVTSLKRPYTDAGLQSVQDVITGNGPASSARKSRSMRVQANARSKRRSRGSVRSRLR